jgi:hypothetical protein
MTPRLSALLQKWALGDWEAEDSIFLDYDAIQYLGLKAYGDYEPAQFDSFADRLDRWLHNVEDEKAQEDLFRLLGRLFFIGRSEFESLCRAAHHGPVLRWLVRELDIDIADPKAGEALERGVATTWFCPITDSMRINSYLKVNRLGGRSHQPDWRSMRKFGRSQALVEYIQSTDIERIVLLEDFVGSGTQMRSAVHFAAELPSPVPVLACPLIVCPEGETTGNSLAALFGNVTFEPVLKVAPGMLFKAKLQEGEPPLHAAIRELTASVRERLAPPGRWEESMHGFKGTGAVVAMYSNCPNNSLPILRDQTPDWNALFPRIKRN